MAASPLVVYHVFSTAEKSRQIFLRCRKLCRQRRKVDECAKVKAQSQHAETLEAGDRWMPILVEFHGICITHDGSMVLVYAS